MRLNPPPPLSYFDMHNEREFRDGLLRALIPVVSQDEAVPYLHLRAPDGGVWRVEVSNTGMLTTTKVQG